MSGNLKYDADYWNVISAYADQPKPQWNDVFEFRAFTENLLRTIFRMGPTPDHVQETKITFKSHDGAKINLHRFATPEVIKAKEPSPAVLYIHGGGMVSCSVEIFAPSIARNANLHSLPFFAVDYRLAPEHPAPTPVEDCYAALKYLSEHAKEYNIDPKRICVMGDSAGGGLGAGVTLLARDRKLSPPVAKQLLIYPMLDDRTVLPADSQLRQFLSWNESDSLLAWKAYLGEDKAGKPEADVSFYSVPARAPSYAGLPPTYLEVGGLDIFRDETIEYAKRLSQENVEVEFHLWPGVPHGFESAPAVQWTTRALGSRGSALKRF
jgi:acetyl esterase/lipase